MMVRFLNLNFDTLKFNQNFIIYNYFSLKSKIEKKRKKKGKQTKELADNDVVDTNLNRTISLT